MEFLKLLEGLRTPFWDSVMSVITYLGDEAGFMIVGMILVWCVNRRWGFRFFFMFMVGNILNQFLKAIFLVPRPWVQDPSFSIVESARDGATGYSFPSGHTQSACVTLGGAASFSRKWWVHLTAAVLILLTAFSRMYLGVHTPLDVGVSLVTGALTVLFFTWLFNKNPEERRRNSIVILLLGVLFAVAFLLYVYLRPVRPANVPEFDAHAHKNAFVMLGTILGLVVSWFLQEYRIDAPVKAVWWAQLIKCAVGFALVIGARAGLKPVLALLDIGYVADGVRYFVMVMIGLTVWPLTFRFFSRLGGKDAPDADAALVEDAD